MSIAVLGQTIGLAVFHKIAQLWKSDPKAMTSDSLIDYTSAARLEPLLLIDQRIKDNDFILDAVQSNMNQFAGFYLQAIALSGNVGSVKIMEQLDKFNPNRDTVFAAKNSSWFTSTEAYADSLPMFDQPQPALEASANVGNAVKDLKDAANLSVGRMLNVEFSDPQNPKNVRVIPISLRMMSNFVSPTRLVEILSTGAEKDMSARDRAYSFKSGQLDFIKDILFCNDKIDSERKKLIKDSDGLYAAMTTTKGKNLMAAVVSGRPSIGAASAMVIIGSDTAADLEMELGGPLSNFRSRQLVFDNTSTMILTVIDPDWHKATFYYRGIAQSNDVDLRALRASNKNGGPDPLELLKAFQLGNAPKL